MKTVLALALILIILFQSFGQEVPEKFRLRQTKVKKLNGEVRFGSLFSVSDSTIVIVSTDEKENIKNGEYYLSTINATDIKKVMIYRKGKIWKSTLTGFGTGIIIGGIYGHGQGDDTSGAWGKPDSQAYAYAGMFGFLGAIYGTIIGVIIPNRHYRIEGDLDKYQLKKPNLERLAVIK